MVLPVEASTDGRSARRARNRDAVLDAVVDLFAEGRLEPGLDEVAARASVSNRSIYRYFEHRDHLMRTAVSHALRRYIPVLLLADVGVGSFDERVEAFAAHRLRVHEQLAPIIRAALLTAVNEPIVAEEVEAGRLVVRQTFVDQFAQELDPLGSEARDSAILAAEVGFQFEGIAFLYKATGANAAAVHRVLAGHISMCLRQYT